MSFVSVIIPAHSAAATLVEALDSVVRQTRAVQEIIIVDDVSTDDTVRVFEDWQRKATGAPATRLLRLKLLFRYLGLITESTRPQDEERVLDYRLSPGPALEVPARVQDRCPVDGILAAVIHILGRYIQNQCRTDCRVVHEEIARTTIAGGLDRRVTVPLGVHP